MEEVLLIAAQVLILSSFIGPLVFYGFVFWHWHEDAKHRHLGRHSMCPR